MNRYIAIVHPYLSIRGGAEAVCIEAISTFLAAGDRVTLFVAEGKEQAILALKATLGEDAQRVDVRSPLSRFVRLAIINKPPVLLGYAALLRALRSVDLSSYSHVFSTFGECDLVEGRKQLCYIHFPVLHSSAGSVSKLGGRLENRVYLRLLYTRIARLISGFSSLPTGSTLLTNSDWTKKQIHSLVGEMDVKVLFPPVRGPGVGLSRCVKPNDLFGCLVLGRFETYKRQDTVVHALDEAARMEGRKAVVHFAGRGADADIARLKALATENVRIEVHLNASMAELRQLVLVNHIAASGFRHEHFGMATAELLSTGLPVFVPNGGGQPEVVRDGRFVFETTEELTAKFRAVMNGAWSLEELQGAALKSAAAFSEGQFATNLLEVFAKCAKTQ